MTSPYRENALEKPNSVTVWMKGLLWRLRFFRFARKRLGGHWERHWLPPGPHAPHGDYGEWGPWLRVEKCTEPHPTDTAGCPSYDECEWWDCSKCLRGLGGYAHGARHSISELRDRCTLCGGDHP